MRTPAGKECKYFYGDYYRGREHEECRLLNSAAPPLEWRTDLCNSCPIPEILLANACPHMGFVPSLKRQFPLLQKKVVVTPVCSSSGLRNFNPHIGCGECHPLPDVFRESLD